jgi:transposase InsO family protein
VANIEAISRIRYAGAFKQLNYFLNLFMWRFIFAQAIEEAFVDYNRRRIHSSLGYLTPMEYLDAWKRGRVKVEAKVNSWRWKL